MATVMVAVKCKPRLFTAATSKGWQVSRFLSMLTDERHNKSVTLPFHEHVKTGMKKRATYSMSNLNGRNLNFTTGTFI